MPMEIYVSIDRFAVSGDGQILCSLEKLIVELSRRGNCVSVGRAISISIPKEMQYVYISYQRSVSLLFLFV